MTVEMWEYVDQLKEKLGKCLLILQDLTLAKTWDDINHARIKSLKVLEIMNDYIPGEN